MLVPTGASRASTTSLAAANPCSRQLDNPDDDEGNERNDEKDKQGTRETLQRADDGAVHFEHAPLERERDDLGVLDRRPVLRRYSPDS